MSSAPAATPAAPPTAPTAADAQRMHALVSRMRSDTLFADAVVCVKGADYRVHRAVLGALCPFFRAAFQSGFRESEESRVELVSSREAVEVLLDYAYGADVTALYRTGGVALWLDVWDLALMLDVEGLREIAASTAVSVAGVEGCVGVWKQAKVFSDLNSMRAVYAFMVPRLVDVAEADKEGFCSLAIDDLVAFIASVDFIAKEAQVFRLVSTWLDWDLGNRIVFRDLLFNQLHFERVSVEEANEIISKSSDMLSKASLRRIALHVNQRAIRTDGAMLPVPANFCRACLSMPCKEIAACLDMKVRIARKEPPYPPVDPIGFGMSSYTPKRFVPARWCIAERCIAEGAILSRSEAVA